MVGSLHVVSKPEQQFLDDAFFAAERAKGKKLSGMAKRGIAGRPRVASGTT